MMFLVASARLTAEAFGSFTPEMLTAALQQKLDEHPKEITFDQLNGALEKTDCEQWVNDKNLKIPANDTCWHFKRPKACPKGYIKYKEMKLVKAKIGAAQVNVADGNQVSLVIGDVKMEVAKTKFTVQNGLFPCDGHITAVIEGAAAAVQGALSILDGIPTIGEMVATPLKDAVVSVAHALDGLCGVLEQLIQGILGMLVQDLENIFGNLLPGLVGGLLKDLVGIALGARRLEPWLPQQAPQWALEA